jgi:hypothetical protein
MRERPVSSAAPDDEPQGDQVDQAQRLQAVDEQQAIDSALGEQPPDDHREIDPEYLATLTRDSAGEDIGTADS